MSLPSSGGPSATTTTTQHRRKSLPFNANINIIPEYLLFPPPHQGRAIQNIIYIYNTGDLPCVYKLRTENPNRYVAKPNVAVIAPKSATRIKVTLCVTPEEGTIAADTQERFRISVKALRKPPGDMPPKEVWSTCQEPVTHEKDILAYFRTDMATPSGGMITFLPEKYVAAVASARSSAANSSNRQQRSSQTKPSQQRTDTSSQPPSRLSRNAAAAPAEDSDAGADAPQASRQLASDLDSAAAAADGATALQQKTRRTGRGPRTWKTFLQASALAILVAYGVGLACRLVAKGEGGLSALKAPFRSLSSREAAADAAPSPATMEGEDGSQPPSPQPLPTPEPVHAEYQEFGEESLAAPAVGEEEVPMGEPEAVLQNEGPSQEVDPPPPQGYHEAPQQEQQPEEQPVYNEVPQQDQQPEQQPVYDEAPPQNPPAMEDHTPVVDDEPAPQ